MDWYRTANRLGLWEDYFSLFFKMAGVTRLRQGLTNFIAWMKISKGMDRLVKEVNERINSCYWPRLPLKFFKIYRRSVPGPSEDDVM